MKHMTELFMAAALALPILAVAQDEPREPRRGDAPRARVVPPLMGALDADRNGVIDEAEIKDAAEALRKLDKNQDGKLTAEELRPARPEGAPAGERFGPRDGNGPAGDGPRPGRRGPRPPEGQ